MKYFMDFTSIYFPFNFIIITSYNINGVIRSAQIHMFINFITHYYPDAKIV